MARVTWIGHGTALVDLDGVRLLTDPLLRNRVAHLRRHVPPPAAEALRDLDAVLLTHLHRDHLDLPSLRRSRATCRSSSRAAAAACCCGADSTRCARSRRASEIAVGALDGARRPRRATTAARGVVGRARAGARLSCSRARARIYHAGDTDLFDGMREIGAAGLDLALVPIWGWASRLGPGHLDPLRAAQALELLHPRRRGADPLGHVRRRPGRAPSAAPTCARRSSRSWPPRASSRPDVEVVPLEPGESLEL